MEKIETIALSRMRNNEHFQFMTDVDRFINSFQPVELGIDNLYPSFETALVAEDAAMRVEIGSLKSKRVEALDILRDRTWNAISLRVDSCLLSPFPHEAESAEALRRIIDLYGDFRARSFNEETSGISNLVADLMKPENEQHIINAGIQNWTNELGNQNAEFQEVFNDRNTELAARESGDVRAVRIQIDPIYEKIAARINASVVMEIAKPVAFEFIAQLNQKISYYKTTFASRETKAKPTDRMETTKVK